MHKVIHVPREGQSLLNASNYACAKPTGLTVWVAGGTKIGEL